MKTSCLHVSVGGFARLHEQKIFPNQKQCSASGVCCKKHTADLSIDRKSDQHPFANLHTSLCRNLWWWQDGN